MNTGFTEGIDAETRMSLLRQHGNFSQAYSVAFQDALERFGDDRGFLAYKMLGGTALVLAEPIAATGRRDPLVHEFIDTFGDVVFCGVSRLLAQFLVGRGFLVNNMGFESCVELANLTFTGRKHRNWRTAINRMASEGVSVREGTLDTVDIEALRRVSDRWRTTRTVKKREVAFLTRPIALSTEPEVRYFFAFDDADRLIAFSFFDPVYQDGEIIGYVAQFKRRLPEVSPYTNLAIMRRAIETFQREDRKWLFLGLAPLAGAVDEPDFPNSRFVRRAFIWSFRNTYFNRYIYPLRGHASHKSHYGGKNEQIYLAFNKSPSLPRLIKLLRACHIIPW